MASLATQLLDALYWARRHPNLRTRTVLAGGLRITVYIDELADVHLLLARDGEKGPSDQEAATVLKHLPEGLPPAGEWTRGKNDTVSWMATSLLAERDPKQLDLFSGAK